ncbi:MAG: methyltransferase domain-containing protein [Actinocrinis sp.]
MTSESPFAAIDRAPEDMQRLMIGYLDASAGHHEIHRVRSMAYELFAPAVGERLLDAGCGTGEVARQLAVRVGTNGSVTGVDHSSKLIAVATSRDPASAVEYRTGDITALDFPDGHFDGVRTERVLQHLPDPCTAIKELARVTRPGGRVCVIDTDWTSVTSDGFDHMDEVVGQLAMFTVSDSGRRARSRMVRAGLVETVTHPVTLRFTTPSDAAAVVPVTNSVFLRERITPELYERFVESVEQSAQRGDFLLAFTMWISLGRVPVG